MVLLYVMKKVFKHFSSKWYIYVAWAIAASALWSIVFTCVHSPGKEERIALFVGTYYCDTAQLKKELNNHSPEYVRKCAVQFVPTDDFLFDMYFASYGTLYADIIILQKDRVTDDRCRQFFSELNTVYLSDYLGETQLYYVDGLPYGILMEKQNSCIYSQDGDSCILFFNKKSQHIGQLNHSEKDGAISLVKKILEL